MSTRQTGLTGPTIALLASVLLAGCAPATRIASNRAQDYASEPKRIFVMSSIGGDFGKDFGDAFHEKLSGVAKDCGAEMEVSRVTALELDENLHLSRMKRFNPDSLLVIRRAGGTVDPYGNLVNATYDVRLVDVKTNKTVWRASSRVVRGGGLIPLKERGSTFAVELTNKLKEDQILKACQIIPIQK